MEPRAPPVERGERRHQPAHGVRGVQPGAELVAASRRCLAAHERVEVRVVRLLDLACGAEPAEDPRELAARLVHEDAPLHHPVCEPVRLDGSQLVDRDHGRLDLLGDARAFVDSPHVVDVVIGIGPFVPGGARAVQDNGKRLRVLLRLAHDAREHVVHQREWARYSSRSERVTTPIGLPASATTTAFTPPVSAVTISSTDSSASIVVSGPCIATATSSCSASAFLNTRSSSARSWSEPITSLSDETSPSRTTGSCEIE